MTRYSTLTAHDRVRVQFSIKLACGYLHDACHDLARLLAHPNPVDGRWRQGVKAATAYWWRARVGLRRIANRNIDWLRTWPTSQFVAWCAQVPRLGRMLARS